MESATAELGPTESESDIKSNIKQAFLIILLKTLPIIMVIIMVIIEVKGIVSVCHIHDCQKRNDSNFSPMKITVHTEIKREVRPILS